MTDTADGPREYRIGETIYEVRAFKGSKGVRAFAIVSRVLRDRFRPILEADAKFQADYRELNALKITRGLAAYRIEQAQAAIAALEAEAEVVEAGRATPPDGTPAAEHGRAADDQLEALGHLIRAQEINRDQWSRMLQGALADREEITVPQAPGNELRAAAAFPLLWDVAEDEMTMLLGLALIPDEELSEARSAGGGEGADAAVRDLGQRALDYLELDQIADLMMSVVEVAATRMRERSGGLGNRWAALQESLWGRQTTDEPEQPTDRPTPGTFVGREEVPLQTGSESSSTDSPTDTGGPPSEPSLASSGTTS